jgi:hypothetical protein
VVLATVTETLHDGIVAGPAGMVYTRHLLKVEEYYIGSGPEQLTVLTPGGFERQPDGRETYTSVVAEGGIGLRPGETFLGFLQVLSPAYKFLNRRGAKVLVAVDESAHERMVSLRFGKVSLLGAPALERYERLKKDLETVTPAERDRVKAKLAYALTELIPVTDLASRMKLVLRDVGGAKPATTTCY